MFCCIKNAKKHSLDYITNWRGIYDENGDNYTNSIYIKLALSNKIIISKDIRVLINFLDLSQNQVYLVGILTLLTSGIYVRNYQVNFFFLPHALCQIPIQIQFFYAFHRRWMQFSLRPLRPFDLLFRLYPTQVE